MSLSYHLTSTQSNHHFTTPNLPRLFTLQLLLSRSALFLFNQLFRLPCSVARFQIILGNHHNMVSPLPSTRSGESPPAKTKILMLTNVDRGEANVFLSACRRLIEADANVEIHFSSFTGLEQDVEAVWQEAQRAVPSARFPIAYHVIDGPNMETGLKQTMKENNTKVVGEMLPESFLQTLSFTTTKQAIRDMVPIMSPYTGPQMVQVYSSIVDIIKTIDADIVVVDSLMMAALTACCHLGVNFVCLSPNSIKEFAAPMQPRSANLWKFPSVFTGHSFPVPWYQIPINIFFALYIAKRFIYDKRRLAVAEYFKEHTGADMKTPIDYLRNRPENLQILVSTWPEIDFPLVIPDHIRPCGPIVRHVSPLLESDAELHSWISQAPTIYVNLGSLLRLSEDRAAELAAAFRLVIEQSRNGLQLLWKLKREGEYAISGKESKIGSILDSFSGQVRIVNWITAEPIAVLSSSQVICSVHHGGANSFNEAVIAGVPHVILPQWTDCYDYAERAEYRKIGRHGSRTHKPLWEAKELSAVILDVIQGPNAAIFKENAQKLSQVCKAKGDGATHVAKALLEACQKAKGHASSDDGKFAI